MKKLFSLVFFAALAFQSYAQTVSFLVSAAPCHNDGVLDVYFTGLTPPLTVTWQTYGTTGAAIIHTDVSGLADALTWYSGGEITLLATDATGVSATGAYAGNPPFTICPLTVTPGICPQLDTLNASVCTGGTLPFTYQWYNIGSTGAAGTGSQVYEPTGSYGVNVTDGAGCTFGSRVSNISAFAYSVPAFSDSINTTIADCTNGSAIVFPYNGGTPPFSFLWSNGATSPSLDGLVAGQYTVTITDAFGCNLTDVTNILQSITLSTPIATTAATCAGADGTATAFPSGGTPPYTYLWSNGATTASLTGLTASFYGVDITDANGCTGTGGNNVGATSPISVTSSATPSLCISPTGNATLSITGGSGIYSITWYTTPAQTGITATALAAGTYAYQVTDGSGCTQTGTATVPPMDVIGVSFLSTPAVCTLSNGSLTAYPVGGVAPYSYAWSTGATSATITSAPAGPYSVTVTDHVGCKATKTQSLPDSSPLGVGISNNQASCIFSNDGAENAIVWGGTPPYVYAWSSGGTTATISALPYGPYWLTVTDGAGCTSANNYSYVSYDPADSGCFCTISGTVYQDMNFNCIQDPGEPGIPNIQVGVSGMGYTYTDKNGYYSVKVPSGAYTVTESTPSFYPISPCQLNGIAVSVTASAGCVHTVNFANVMDTVHDMHISTWDYDLPMPVPGQTYRQVTIVSNDGSAPEDSILVNYNNSGQLFTPAFTPSGIFTGSANHYTTSNFPVLNPGIAQEFFMNYTVPANIAAGTSITFSDTVSYRSPIDYWQIDYTPANNINSFTTTVVNSAATNFKEVSPKGTGSTGIISYTDSVLEYMVHFQNTGNVTAENMVIIDTLDDNLNWTTLQPVFQSAPCKIMLTQNGTKKVAQFIFSEINLPAKQNDEMRSNGMLTYTVHINSGLPTGTQIRNHSSVYFDYNAPVITNSTLNTIGAAAAQGVAALPAANGNTFAVYPNPASKSFTAFINSDATGAATMTIADVTGKALINKSITLQKGGQTITTDISRLAPGVYFVTLNGNGNTQTQKLVITN